MCLCFLKLFFLLIFSHIALWSEKMIDMISIFFCLFVFLGLHPQHMGIPMLGVKSELQLQAYPTAIAMQDPSHVCDLHHSSQQHQILNPLSKARDWICIRMDASQIHFQWAMTGTPISIFLNFLRLDLCQDVIYPRECFMWTWGECVFFFWMECPINIY